MILIVHFRLDTISLIDISILLRGLVGMQPYFLPVLPFDEIVLAFHAQHFALDHITTLQFILLAFQISLAGILISLDHVHAVFSRSHRICLRSARETKAQKEATLQETDDFWNCYHKTLLGLDKQSIAHCRLHGVCVELGRVLVFYVKSS